MSRMIMTSRRRSHLQLPLYQKTAAWARKNIQLYKMVHEVKIAIE